MTLIELVVTSVILSILALGAMPLARYQIKREKEKMLRYDLEQMRDAIDAYKDAADRGAFQVKIETYGYPPDMDTLTKGVEIQGKKVVFLRAVPVDPMTGKAEWAMRSMEDDPTSDSWDGKHIFDVRSKSTGTALNGTKYSDW